MIPQATGIFTKREHDAMNAFASLYLNTGCDEVKAKEVAEALYRKFLQGNYYNVECAILALEIESFYYMDI